MNLATAQTSLGFCWAAVEGAKTGITPQSPCHTVTLCTEHCRTHAGYHSLALFVCSIFLAKPRAWTEPPTGMDTGWRYSVFSFKLSLNWTMLLCLASWSLLSSPGAWLLTQRDEAKGNELDRPGRQNTAHALPSSFWEKGSRGLQIVSLNIHILPLNFCLVLLCPQAQTASMSFFSFSTISPWVQIQMHKPVLRWAHLGTVIPWCTLRYLHVYCTQRYIFTLCFRTFSDGLKLIRGTYR